MIAFFKIFVKKLTGKINRKLIEQRTLFNSSA